jgi:diguanylate cyclase (GGDEF)-like protein
MRHAAIVTAGAVIVGYVVLLLFSTYLSQSKLRDSILAQHRIDLEKHAAAVHFFYAERIDDVASVGYDKACQDLFSGQRSAAFEAGRRQGSVAECEHLLGNLAVRKRLGEESVFLRAAVFDLQGRLVAAAPQGQRAQVQWHPEIHGQGGVQILVLPEHGRDTVLVSLPYFLRGERVGHLAAWVNPDSASRLLVPSEAQSLGSKYYLVPLDELPSALGPFLSALEHAETGMQRAEATFYEDTQFVPWTKGSMALSERIPNTPFYLVSVFGKDELFGYLASPWFIISLALLALVVFAGATLLVRANMHNLTLLTRIQESRRQEEHLSTQNLRLAQEIQIRTEYQKRLARQANYDQLTGLPNRLLAFDRLSQALKRAERDKKLVMLMFVDLDHFKRVNDTLGHTAGDQLLTQASERLNSAMRSSDTVARLGGDEFLIVAPDLESVDGSEHLVEKILRRFAEPFLIKNHEFYVTASIGLAVYPHDGEDVETLLQHADTALYRAKESGRQAYRFFTSSMNQRAKERMRMEGYLLHAVERDELFLVYQSQVELRTKRVKGAEALLRWCNPELGEVPTQEFIPLAEETGFIQEIGAWVLKRACEDAMRFNRVQPTGMAVNISASQFRQPDRLLSGVRGALQQSGLQPHLLTLEVKECLLLDDLAETRHALNELHALGVRLAIDDFGTGYSALSALRRFSFDVLKIDRSFVHDALLLREDAALTQALLAMAEALGLEVLAEGVEDAAQMAFLRTNGCPLAQGYYFGVPMVAEDLLQLLASNAGVLKLVQSS